MHANKDANKTTHRNEAEEAIIPTNTHVNTTANKHATTYATRNANTPTITHANNDANKHEHTCKHIYKQSCNNMQPNIQT